MTKQAQQQAPSSGSPKSEYKPSEQEAAALERFRSRRAHAKPAPKFKVEYEGNTAQIHPDHAEETYSHVLTADLFATGDSGFSAGLLEQTANVARAGKNLTSRELNFALSVVRAIDPRDPTEALLAAQMMAVHNATMVAARRLAHTETIAQQDSANNMLNKLARTFAAQLEALKRYRSTGEQVVKVQHVQVTANQAVVGINQGGGGNHENASQSHAPRESALDERGPALLGQEQAQPMPLPSASCKGAERVQDARRASGSAARGG